MSVTRVLDKTSSFGALVSAMSCAGCFPALGSLGAALGLGFLGQYEGFLFRKCHRRRKTDPPAPM